VKFTFGTYFCTYLGPIVRRSILVNDRRAKDPVQYYPRIPLPLPLPWCGSTAPDLQKRHARPSEVWWGLVGLEDALRARQQTRLNQYSPQNCCALQFAPTRAAVLEWALYAEE